MFKKCSKFYWSTLRDFYFIRTVYELFDNSSYIIIVHESTISAEDSPNEYNCI